MSQVWIQNCEGLKNILLSIWNMYSLSLLSNRHFILPSHWPSVDQQLNGGWHGNPNILYNLTAEYQYYPVPYFCMWQANYCLCSLGHWKFK
jgi:hypothetical protein